MLGHEPSKGAAGPVERYLQRLSPASQRSQAQALRRAAAALGHTAEPGRVAWHRLTPTDVERLRDGLLADLAPASVNKALSAVRGVLREAAALGLAPAVAPGEGGVPWVRTEERGAPTPRLLTSAELRRLRRACWSDPSPGGRRDGAALAILLATGLRRAELAALDRDDYDGGTGRLRISAGPAAREAVLPPDARAALDRWLRERGAAPGPLLLPVNRSGRIGRRRLTDQAVYDLVRKRGRACGIGDLTTRSLRRTLAARLIAEGHDLEAVRAGLGHASWVTTAAYRALAEEVRARSIHEEDAR